jgi:hypothetical protein
MNAEIFAPVWVRRLEGFATCPLARLDARLLLSLVVAGFSLPPSRFAAVARPDALSGASNYGF